MTLFSTLEKNEVLIRKISIGTGAIGQGLKRVAKRRRKGSIWG